MARRLAWTLAVALAWGASSATGQAPAVVRITGGQPDGIRHVMALKLQETARERPELGLTVQVQTTAGSTQALTDLNAGALDAALIQGAIPSRDYPAVRLAGAVGDDVLHLLVKRGATIDEGSGLSEEVGRDLKSLRGRTVNLGEPGSGTYLMACDLLRKVAGFDPERDVRVHGESYHWLREAVRDPARHNLLPDAVFTVSAVPSPVAKDLIELGGFVLVEPPSAALYKSYEYYDPSDTGLDVQPAPSLIDARFVTSSVLAQGTYAQKPRVPDRDLPTLAVRELLVVRAGLPEDDVVALLRCVAAARIVGYDPKRQFEEPPEYPWHPGAERYRDLGQPLVSEDLVQFTDSIVELIWKLGAAVSFAVIGLIAFRRWIRRRLSKEVADRVEKYLKHAFDIERRVEEEGQAPQLDLERLKALKAELIALKRKVHERFAQDQIEGKEYLQPFLLKVESIDDQLNEMVLHERDNQEEQALRVDRRDRGRAIDALHWRLLGLAAGGDAPALEGLEGEIRARWEAGDLEAGAPLSALLNSLLLARLVLDRAARADGGKKSDA